MTSDDTELTVSEQKTKKMLYEVIGRKIAESRKSSRRKLEGISKKLNISVDILKKIESGTIHEVNSDIPVTGFVRAYAKFTNTEISEEMDKIQSNYLVSEKVKNIYQQRSNIKTSKIFFVFLASFSFLLLVLYFFSIKESETSLSIIENNGSNSKEFFSREFQNYPKTKKTFTSQNNEIEENKVDSSFFEIIFLEETWIEIYNKEKDLVNSGLYDVGDSLDFTFDSLESDYFIKSGNLGGFQIFFMDEFFAPFGYSGEVNKGFYLKEKIKRIKEMRL